MNKYVLYLQSADLGAGRLTMPDQGTHIHKQDNKLGVDMENYDIGFVLGLNPANNYEDMQNLATKVTSRMSKKRKWICHIMTGNGISMRIARN